MTFCGYVSLPEGMPGMPHVWLGSRCPGLRLQEPADGEVRSLERRHLRDRKKSPGATGEMRISGLEAERTWGYLDFLDMWVLHYGIMVLYLSKWR